MRHIKIYENFSNNRISEDIIDVIEVLSNYNKPFDIDAFGCLERLNGMSQDELDEFYESVSTNRRNNNSNEENFMMDIIEKFNLSKSFKKQLNESVESYEGFYIIGWGLSGGFGGIQNYEVIKADSLEEAEKDSYQRALDEYENYSGYHGLRSVDDIMEEDGVDSDEAEEIYNEEREGWLDYVAKTYSKEYEKKVKDYHYNNPYKEEIDSIN